MEEPRLTHVDHQGEARMVDVGGKAVTRRVARAGARVWMAPETLNLLREQALPKGDVLAVAKIAGIMAAKRTFELVPLCHPLPLSYVDVNFAVVDEDSRVDIECVARTEARTGVEMEALTGAAAAAITVYDMCKAVDKGMVIGDIRLLEKTGGKEDYFRPGEDVGTDAGMVVAVNVSAEKGERKHPVDEIQLRPDQGVVGDAHVGSGRREVSLLAQESIDKMLALGLEVGPGDFAENITTRGLDLTHLPPGTVLEVGEAVLEITQIGKECHSRCAIYHQAGDCIMPREGVFARVVEGGRVTAGDRVRVRVLGSGPEGDLVRKAETVLFPPLRAMVVTLSDKASAGLRADSSGPALVELLREFGAKVGEPIVLSDDRQLIERTLAELSDSGNWDLVLTTGGTGLAPRDHAPEATLAVVDRLAPGFAEAMRASSSVVTASAMLSRAVAGIRGRTLIINLPGSPKACREQFAVIAPVLVHAVETLRGEAYECGGA